MTNENETMSVDYESRIEDPCYINDKGTKFWELTEFNDLLDRLHVTLYILQSENVVDNELHWSYIIVDKKGKILYKSRDKEELVGIVKEMINKQNHVGRWWLLDFLKDFWKSYTS